MKDPGRLVAAYDDAAGVTAAFNRNVLHVLNRELDADFDPDAFEHVALWNAERRLDRDAAPRRRGDHARRGSARSTSTSTSPTARRCAPRSAPSSAPTACDRELVSAGFEVNHRYIDPTGDFSLFLASA